MDVKLNTGRVLDIEPNKNCPNCQGGGLRMIKRRNYYDLTNTGNFATSSGITYTGAGGDGFWEEIITETCNCVLGQVDYLKIRSESFIL